MWYICKAKGLYFVENLDDVVLFGDLYELYGKLLPKSQIDVGDLYFNNNFTISEIADILNKTRQAVYDSLKKTQAKLIDYENKVGALKMIKELKGKTSGTF